MIHNNSTSVFTNSTKSLTSYLKDVRRQKTLSQEENFQQALLVAQGDEHAREKMISGNLCIVLTACKPYMGCGLSEEDLVQVGNEGLIYAVDKFDPTKGAPFYPYAKACIEGHIKDALHQEASCIYVPRSAQESEDNTWLDMDESGELVERQRPVIGRIVSLESPFSNDEDSGCYGDLLAQDESSDADSMLMTDERRRELDMLLRQRYSKREQEVIRLRLGLDQHPMQVWQIAETLGCTPACVYNILHKVAPEAA